MGRKPQPLTRAESIAPGDQPGVGETVGPPQSPTSPSSSFELDHQHSVKPPADTVKHVLPKNNVPQLFASAAHPAFTQQRAEPPARVAQQQQRQQRLQHPQEYQNQGRQSHGHRNARNDQDKSSKSGFFFNFNKSSKSSDRSSNTHQYTDSGSETMRDRETEHPGHSKQQLSRPSEMPESGLDQSIATQPSKSDLSLASSADIESGSIKKGKAKPFALLSRTKSMKDREISSPKENKLSEPEKPNAGTPHKFAPAQSTDGLTRDMMPPSAKNHSADQSQSRDMSVTKARESAKDNGKEHARDSERDGHRGGPSSLKENNGGLGLFSGLKSSSSKAADMISKGLFGKNSRNGHVDKEPVVDDEHYVLKVINLPLVEQTRRTRISKRLEESRDKTEFWMPAFPWRAIDYLNYKGSDVEGLYRVPGSGPQIKKWQRRFDEEGDVDLFEQQDLYDINIIGSMLKAWLRELPDELFPKESQEKIARECSSTDTVPQLLIDELSNLSPFKYYLLFAITCHLSLLLAHSDKNKMDFRNLCICFQPCMKIDAFCFKYLVCDWRDCWKGCKSEAKYIEEEYALFDQPPPQTISDPNDVPANQEDTPAEDRNELAAEGGTKASGRNAQEPKEPKGRLRKKAGGENGSVDTASTISSALTVNSDREPPPKPSGDMRPLSPIKPLSPLGF